MGRTGDSGRIAGRRLGCPGAGPRSRTATCFMKPVGDDGWLEEGGRRAVDVDSRETACSLFV